MGTSFRAPTEDDIQLLLANLSQADKDELLIQGVEPEWALRHSVEVGEESVAIFQDGELACITGITVNDGLGVPSAMPWMLGTDVLASYPRKVLYYSKWLIRRWNEKHPYLYNFVDVRHERAAKWLEHLGFTKELVPEHGPYLKPFYKFTLGEP